jgi:mercuric ion binding protein
MKTLLNFTLVILLISAIGCSKKNANQTAGDKTADTKGVTDKVESVEFKCAGMHCSGCEETITTEVKKMDGVKDIKADSKTKIVNVSFDANKTNKDNISKAINTAGYDTELSKSDSKHDCETDMKKDEKNN